MTRSVFLSALAVIPGVVTARALKETDLITNACPYLTRGTSCNFTCCAVFFQQGLPGTTARSLKKTDLITYACPYLTPGTLCKLTRSVDVAAGDHGVGRGKGLRHLVTRAIILVTSRPVVFALLLRQALSVTRCRRPSPPPTPWSPAAATTTARTPMATTRRQWPSRRSRPDLPFVAGIVRRGC